MVLAILFVLSVCVALASLFYAFRWAQIILMLEDDLSDALEIHERSIETFDRILKMQLFFDSPDVKPILEEVMADIKSCKIATQRVINNFTQRSKHKYERIEEEN